MTEEEELLSELVGRELSSVEFVRDYMQFRFDGPCLTAFTPPMVFSSGRRLVPRGIGYRDELVGLVGDKVAEARFSRDEELVLTFDSGRIIRVALDAASRGAPPESVFFDLNDERHRSFAA